MTAYVDFAFTEAEGWTDSANALSDKVAGYAASGSIAAGNDTPTLTLSLPSIAIADDGTDPAITGIKLDVWATFGSFTATDRIYDTVQLLLPMGLSSDLSASTIIQRGQNFVSPAAANVFGGETNLWGYSAVSLAQFTPAELRIVASNNGSKSATFLAWNVQGRIWLDALSMEDIAKRAFRKINVLSIDEELDADSLAHGIDLLNDMMFGWEAFGVDINHVERAAGEAFPLARKFVEGTSAQLAERLGSDYQVPAPSSARFFAALSRAYSLDTDADYRDLDGDGLLTEAEIEAAKQARFY